MADMSHSRTQEQIDGLGVAPEDDDVQGHGLSRDSLSGDGDEAARLARLARLARAQDDEPAPEQA
jgi:hypothetical protein